MKLIIHADDFGYSKSVNEAIIDLCQLGSLSSTSIMANMPFALQAKELVSLKHISLGLHSTFTQDKPVSNPKFVKSLIDQKGYFLDYATMAAKAKKNQIPINEIVYELRSQHEFVKSIIGERLTFIDAHHSIHNKLIPFRKAFIVFGKELNKPVLRTSQFHYIEQRAGDFSFIQPTISSIHRFGTRKVLVNYFYRYGSALFAKVYTITDGQITANLNKNETIFHRLTKLKDLESYKKTLYVVAHPATSTKDLKNTMLTKQRVEEYNYMKTDEFLAFISNANIVNFSMI